MHKYRLLSEDRRRPKLELLAREKLLTEMGLQTEIHECQHALAGVQLERRLSGRAALLVCMHYSRVNPHPRSRAHDVVGALPTPGRRSMGTLFLHSSKASPLSAQRTVNSIHVAPASCIQWSRHNEPTNAQTCQGQYMQRAQCKRPKVCICAI